MSDSERVTLNRYTKAFTREAYNHEKHEDYFNEDNFDEKNYYISNKIYHKDEDADKDADKDADSMVIIYNDDIPDKKREIKIRKGAIEKQYTDIEEGPFLKILTFQRALSASERQTLERGGRGGGNYLARGGAPVVRRISASLNNERARQTREKNADRYTFNLHRSFFLIIWEHFAPNSDIEGRPRQYDRRPLNIRLGPIYGGRDRTTFVCSVLLRCVPREDRGAGTTNIAYSVLFEFTQYIHWSIFYSFDVLTTSPSRAHY